MKGYKTPQLRYRNTIKYLEIKDVSYPTVKLECQQFGKREQKIKACLGKRKKVRCGGLCTKGPAYHSSESPHYLLSITVIFQ